MTPGQDLTRVTIPPWFLEPRSLLERWADVLMHPELLHGVFALPTPEERILAVARWFLSGWHYKTVGAKKPFNPIVGETFACFWPHEDGSRTQFFSEQVLHRPPISCVYFENTAHHYKANAHIWTKGSFVFPQSSRSALDGGCGEWGQGGHCSLRGGPGYPACTHIFFHSIHPHPQNHPPPPPQC